MNNEQIEAAARRLCEIWGFEPDIESEVPGVSELESWFPVIRARIDRNLITDVYAPDELQTIDEAIAYARTR